MSYAYLLVIFYSLSLTALVLFTACSTHSGIIKKPEASGTVIILNGASAVGKSSIIKAFQASQSAPWLGMGIDNLFVGVLPPKFYLEDKPEHRLIMHGKASQDERGKLFTLHIGPVGCNIMRGMHQAIAAYARAGNNVIVDYIMYDLALRDDLHKALAGLKVIFVGVTVDLSTLEQREKKRATSPEGHARSLYDTVHNGWHYDLEIKSDSITPELAAHMLADYRDQHP